MAPAALGLWLAAMCVCAYDWLQFNGDPRHSGNNTQESIIAPSNVARLAFLFQVVFPSIADGAPAEVRANAEVRRVYLGERT